MFDENGYFKLNGLNLYSDGEILNIKVKNLKKYRQIYQGIIGHYTTHSSYTHVYTKWLNWYA